MGGFFPFKESIGVSGAGAYTQHHSVGTWGFYKLRACPQQLDRATGVYITPAYTQQLTTASRATVLEQQRMGRQIRLILWLCIWYISRGQKKPRSRLTVYLFRKPK